MDTGGVVLPEIHRAITQVSHSEGQPIPKAVRAPLEQVMGAEFDQVRVHTSHHADDLARFLGARAFTTGHDIFFRRGQYEPSTRAGQRVLAHELTHVIQQAASSIQGRGALVQRLVGFEFETDWGVHGRANPARKPGPEQRLRKHTAYKQGQGFTVQVDEASRGFKEPDYAGLARQIEFVVGPHPESPTGGQALYQTMRALMAEARTLEDRAKARKKDQKGFRYPGAIQDMWVFPDAKKTATPEIHARAQATVGLSLPAISRFGLLPEEELRRTERTQGFTFSHANRAATLVSHRTPFIRGAQAAAQIPGASEDLSGLVTLLVHYIKVFHNPNTPIEDYVKGHLPLLAKTDFAAMFSHLPETEKNRYNRDPRAFARLVLETVNQDTDFNVTKHMPVIPDRLLAGGGHFDLTLGAWLSWIAHGIDLLTSKNDRRLFGLGDLGKGMTKGKRVDVAPGTGKPRMILEFRSGSVGSSPSGIKGFLTPSEWLDYAFDYYNLARRVHTRPVMPEW